MSVPSLLDLCIQAAARSRHWTVQRRSLERLPEHAANDLLDLLLNRQSGLFGPGGGFSGRGEGGGDQPLRPATLELFKYCATRVLLRGAAVTVDWLAALAGFSHLDTLHLTGCSKLTAAALQALILAGPSLSASAALPTSSSPLIITGSSASYALTPNNKQKPSTSGLFFDPSLGAAPSEPGSPAEPLARPSPAAANLRHLDLSGCSRVRDEALPLLACLTKLQSLSISETGVEGSGLSALTSLRGLTRLQAGGLTSVGDEGWVDLLTCLPNVQHLEVWGSNAGGGPHGGEELLVLLAAGLPHLRHLNVAWTPLAALPALPELQVLDMRHCRLHEIWWPAGGTTRMSLQRLLLGGSVLSGPAAATDSESPSGLACLIRHSLGTLELLDLCELTTSEESWVAPLSALAADDAGAPHLTHLDLSRTAVQPEDFTYLQFAPTLQRLAVAGSHVGSPQGVAGLVAARLPGLQALDLSSCSIPDGAVSWLQQLTALTNLNLSGNPNLSFTPVESPTRDQTRGPAPEPEVRDVWADPDAPVVVPAAPAPPRGLIVSDGAANLRSPDSASTAGSTSRSTRCSADGVSSSGGSGGCGTAPASNTVIDASDDEDDEDDSIWPHLQRLNLLGTRVSEMGLRALLGVRVQGSREGRSGERRNEAFKAGHCGGVGRRLEQLKAGGPGMTDGAVAVLAAARLPNLHSLLLRDAPLTGHGAQLLAAGLPSLQRLELQACWLVSEQDAARLSATCGPSVLVVVNGRTAATDGSFMGATESAGKATVAPSTSSSRAGAGPSRCGAKGSTVAKRGHQGRSVQQVASGSTGGKLIAAGATAAGEDLSFFDQRMRYDTEMLMRLAASPLVAAQYGSGERAWVDLPAAIRR